VVALATWWEKRVGVARGITAGVAKRVARRPMVGIYHSRWRAVAARGTRQFTGDCRAGGFVTLSVRRRATHAFARARFSQSEGALMRSLTRSLTRSLARAHTYAGTHARTHARTPARTLVP